MAKQFVAPAGWEEVEPPVAVAETPAAAPPVAEGWEVPQGWEEITAELQRYTKMARRHIGVGQDRPGRVKGQTEFLQKYRNIPVEDRELYLQALSDVARKNPPPSEFDPVESLSRGVEQVVAMPQGVARTMGMLSPEEEATLDFFNAADAIRRGAVPLKAELGSGVLATAGELAQEAVGGVLEMAPAMYAGGVVGRGAGALSRVAGATATTAGRVAAGAGVSYWSAQELPELYDSARRMGVDDDTARVGALVAAPIIGLMERIQFGRVAEPLKGLMRRRIQERALDYSIRAGTKFAESTLVNVAQEGGQQAVGTAMRATLASMEEEVLSGEGEWAQFAKDERDQMVATLRQAALSMPLLQAPGAAAHIASDVSKRQAINTLMARRKQLQDARSKGPISRKTGRDLGIEGTTQKERTANADAEIQELEEQEIQDAEAIRSTEAEVREEEGRQDVRGAGEEQVRQEPASEVAAAPEVPVEPDTILYRRGRKEGQWWTDDPEYADRYDTGRPLQKATAGKLKILDSRLPEAAFLNNLTDEEIDSELQKRGYDGYLVEGEEGQNLFRLVAPPTPLVGDAEVTSPEVPVEETPLKGYEDRTANLPPAVVQNTPIRKVQKSSAKGEYADATAVYDHKTGTLHVIDETSPDFQEELENELIAAWAWGNLTPEQYSQWREAVGRPPSTDVQGGVGGGMSNVDSFAQSVIDWRKGKPWGNSGPLLGKLFGESAEVQVDPPAVTKPEVLEEPPSEPKRPKGPGLGPEAGPGLGTGGPTVQPEVEAVSEKPEELARRAARGEEVERPEGIPEARWRAMIAQQAKRMGLKPKATSEAAKPTRQDIQARAKELGIPGRNRKSEVLLEEIRKAEAVEERPEPAPAPEVQVEEKPAPPKGVGARKATKEGQQRHESARQRMLDIVNSDLEGSERSDAIEHARNLVQFMEANADRDLEMDYFKGDQVAYTGVVDDDGFREFIYLEGHKAGQYGRKISAEARQADQERRQQEFADQQEQFRRLREAEAAADKPSETRPKGPGLEAGGPEVEQEREARLRERLRTLSDEQLRVLNREGTVQVGDETIGDPTAIALEELNRRLDEKETKPGPQQEYVASLNPYESQGYRVSDYRTFIEGLKEESDEVIAEARKYAAAVEWDVESGDTPRIALLQSAVDSIQQYGSAEKALKAGLESSQSGLAEAQDALQKATKKSDREYQQRQVDKRQSEVDSWQGYLANLTQTQPEAAPETQAEAPQETDVSQQVLGATQAIRRESAPRMRYTKKKPDAKLTKSEQAALEAIPEDGLELGHISNALTYDPDLRKLPVLQHKAILSLIDRGTLRVVERPDPEGVLGTKPIGSTGSRLFIVRSQPASETAEAPATSTEGISEAIAKELAERKPKKRSEIAAERKEDAKTRFLESGRRFIDPSKPTTGLDPSKVKDAVDMVLAAIDYGVATFDELVSLAVESFDEQGVRNRAPYLEEAARQAGIEGVTSVSEVLDKQPEPPVTEPTGEADDTTGTKHAKTDELREKLGLGPRVVSEVQTQEELDTEAARMIEADPTLGSRLASELYNNPRALEDPVLEHVMGRHIRDLENRREDGEDVADEMTVAIEASERVGTLEGRVFRARQEVRAPDFSLPGLLRQYSDRVGEEVPREDQAKYGEMADQIKELEAQREALQKKLAEEEVKRKAAEAAKKKPRKAKAGTKKAALQKKATAAVESFKSEWATLFEVGAAYDPKREAEKWDKIVRAAGKVVKAYADMGINSFVEFMAGVRSSLEGITADQEDAFKEAWDLHHKDKVGESPIGEAPDEATIGARAKELTRAAVTAGIEDWNDVIDAVHEQLSREVPGITKYQTMEAMTDYGQYRELPKEEIDVKVRAIRGKTRQALKIEDLTKSIALSQKWLAEGMSAEEVAQKLRDEKSLPKATGFERATPDDLERQMIAEVDKLKKELPVPVESREGQLKSALSTAKTAARNRLVDLNAEIEALEEAIANRVALSKTAEKAPLKPDAELAEQRKRVAERRKQRDELKAEYEKIFPPTKKQRMVTAEQQAQRAQKEIDRLQQELKDIKEGKEKAKAKQPDLVPAKVRQQLQMWRERLKAARKAAKEAERARWEDEGGSVMPPPGRKPLTDAQRLKMAEGMLRRQMEAVKADTKALQEGTWKPTGKGHPITSETKKRLQAELAALKDIRDQARKASPEYQAREDAKYWEGYRKSQERRLEFWENRRREAAAGRLPEPRKKRTPTENDIIDTNLKIEEVQQRALVEIERAKRAKYNIGQWIGEGLYEVTSILPRTLMAGLELSAPFRQGVFYTFGHPIKAVANMSQSMQAVFSERIAHAAFEDITTRPNAREYRLAKVEFTKEEGPHATLEEFFESAIVRWLTRTEGKLWLPLRSYAKAYMMFERGFRTFRNTMAADMYDILKRDTVNIRDFFSEHGLETRPWGEADIKDTGRSANIFSGRGTGLKPGSRWMNWFFFARRWAWSRIQAEFVIPFQMATPKFIGQWNADPAMRVAHAKLYGQALIGLATYMAARYWVYFLASDDDDEKPTVELDTRSTDAWKTKIGETRIDTLGGMQQPAVLASRLLTGKTKGSTSGELSSIYDDGGEHIWRDSADVIIQYGRGKLGPGPSGILDWFSGRNLIGERMTKLDIVRERMTPMTYREIWQAEDELGLARGTIAALDGFFGSSLSTYGPRTEYREGTDEERQEQFEKDLKNMDWDTPDPAYSEFLTDDQMEQVRARRKERSEDVVFNALVDAETDKSKAELENAKQKLKDTGWSHLEAQQQLWNHYSGKMNWDKFRALAALYGFDEDAARLEIQGPVVGGRRSYDTEFGKWMAQQRARWTAERKKKAAEAKERKKM